MYWRDVFRKAAKANGWSWTRVAAESGIPRDRIQNWMRKKADRGQPSISDAIRIAETMGLSLDELFRGRIPDDRLEEILREALRQYLAGLPADAPDAATETKRRGAAPRSTG